MSEKSEKSSSANLETFHHCLICQVEVSKRPFSNSKLCQKFITLASRYYNIHFPDNSINVHKTLKLHQLKTDRVFAQLTSCKKCLQKIDSFCEIYEEVSLLQIHLNASARKITELMKDDQRTKLSNNNSSSPDSEMFEYFRTHFYSRAAQHVPHVRLRKLEIEVSTIENDPPYVPTAKVNSGDRAKIYHSSICSFVPPPPSPPFTERRTEISQKYPAKVESVREHRGKNLTRPTTNNYETINERPSRIGNNIQHGQSVHNDRNTSKKVYSGCEELVQDSSSISAAGSAVEILKSLPHGSLLVLPGKAEPQRHHKCRFCDKTFKTLSNKYSHENTHLQPHQCRFCNRRFSTGFTMMVHERTHTGIKPFKCSVCAETFREKRACRNHLWSVHKGNGELIEDSKHEQESNVVEAKIEPNLSQSKTTPNSPDENPFKCSICRKGFAKRKSLSQHMQTHWRRFICDTCGARYPSKTPLEAHKRTHTGERPYLCPICFRTFSSQQSCTTHQRNVHKIANGEVINTNTYGFKVVPENGILLPTENQTVTPGNQSEHEIKGTELLQCRNALTITDNYILPDTQHEVKIELKESEVTIVDTQLEHPLGNI